MYSSMKPACDLNRGTKKGTEPSKGNQSSVKRYSKDSLWAIKIGLKVVASLCWKLAGLSKPFSHSHLSGMSRHCQVRGLLGRQADCSPCPLHAIRHSVLLTLI